MGTKQAGQFGRFFFALKFSFFIHPHNIFPVQTPSQSKPFDHLLDGAFGKVFIYGVKHAAQAAFTSGSKFDILNILKQPQFDFLKIADSFLHA